MTSEMSWKSVVGEPEIKEGIRVWAISNASPAGIPFYYRVDAQGVWIHGMWKEGKYQTVPNPYIVLGLPLKVGTVWTRSYIGGSELGTIEAFESVEVPVGRFVECLRARTSEFWHGGAVAWYCKGVGMVKSVLYDKSGALDTEVVLLDVSPRPIRGLEPVASPGTSSVGRYERVEQDFLDNQGEYLELNRDGTALFCSPRHGGAEGKYEITADRIKVVLQGGQSSLVKIGSYERSTGTIRFTDQMVFSGNRTQTYVKKR